MNILEVKDFSFAYPDQRKEALVHANMKIEEGTLNVVCGRSGCGKSTLLRQMKSVLAPLAQPTVMITNRPVIIAPRILSLLVKR